MNCAASPFGPPAADGYVTLPYTISSRRFPYQAQPPAIGPQYYINNVDYRWQMWFSGNVTSAKLAFPAPSAVAPGFDTESGWDFLAIQYITLSGWPGMGGAYTSPPVPFQFLGDFPNDNYWNMQWSTDYSTQGPGWTVTSAKVSCLGRTNHPAAASSLQSRLHPNGERDGVLLGTGDIRHFRTVLPADRPLLLFLKQDGPPLPNTDHADYDLYASFGATTMTPGPGTLGVDYDWFSARGNDNDRNMLDDTVLIQPTGVETDVYFSVFAYREDFNMPGGFRVYDNVVGKTFQFRVGSNFNFLNAPDGVNYRDKIEASLRAATGGLYEATDGTALVTEWKVWNNEWLCGGIAGCHIIFRWCPTCTKDYCEISGANPVCNFAAPQQIHMIAPGKVPVQNGYTLQHELGHCLYGMRDEYAPVATPGYVCGHGVMNSSPQLNVADYCTGQKAGCPMEAPIAPNGNHNADCSNPPPVGTFAVDAAGGWQAMQACFPDQVRDYFPIGEPATPDPERFIFSDVWQSPLTVLLRQNY